MIEAQKITFTEASEKMSVTDVFDLHVTMEVMHKAQAAFEKKHAPKE